MRIEQIIEILENFGFKRMHAEIYVYLLENGPRKAKDIGNSLNFKKAQIYKSLKVLQAQKIVEKDNERPSTFSAMDLKQILNLIINSKIEQVQEMKCAKTIFKDFLE